MESLFSGLSVASAKVHHIIRQTKEDEIIRRRPRRGKLTFWGTQLLDERGVELVMFGVSSQCGDQHCPEEKGTWLGISYERR
jgi:hypothetical protein